MEEQALDALIDQYLLGTISPGDKTRLEYLMATDPSVAELVRDSQRAYKAILQERNRLLKEKLRKLDKDDLQDQRSFPGKLGLVFFMTMVLMLAYTLLAVNHHPERIARRNLAEYPVELLAAGTSGQAEAEWHLAKNAFLQNDFKTAIQRYVVLAGERDTPGHYIARWNILMAQLAEEGPTSAWHLAIEAFGREAPEPLAVRAGALSRMFHSRYYKVFFSPWKEKLSALKPRLI